MTKLTETVVPAWIAAALGVATVAMLAATVLLILRSKKAIAAQQNPSAKDAKVLRRLFLAALIPTLLVITAVMGISFVGLSSFARHDMGWHSWISLIVPLSLDGISVTFGFWAFVAVKRGRHPGRSEKIVYVGALISAWINYNHGRQEWTGAAGIYLGFLSLAAAWMFHELLAQFTDAQQTLPKVRRNGIPMFGERWLWAPWSTLLARRAWLVHPPSADFEPTAANALAHLEQVRAYRATKKLRHQAAVDAITSELGHTPAPSGDETPTPNPRTARKATTTKATSKATTSKTTAKKAATTGKQPTKSTDRTASIAAPAPEDTAAGPDSTLKASTPTAAAVTAPPDLVTSPDTPTLTAAASATDSQIAPADAARLKRPVAPALLTRARHIAVTHAIHEGTRITPGELAVRMRVNSDTAAQLLAMLDIDWPTLIQPTSPVNGNPVPTGVRR